MPGNAKVNGTWKELAAVNAKVNGSWKEVAEAYTKVNGTWEQWFSGFSGSLAMEAIQQVVFNGSTNTVTLSSIPQNYVGIFIDFKLSSTASNGALQIQTNNRTSGYHFQGLLNSDSNGNNIVQNSQNSIYTTEPIKNSTLSPSYGHIRIDGYRDTDKFNVINLFLAGTESGSGFYDGFHLGGADGNKEAMTSLKLTVTNGNFANGSYIRMYGMVTA